MATENWRPITAMIVNLLADFYLYKLWEYIDEKSEKWSDDELEQQIDRLLPKKKKSN